MSRNSRRAAVAAVGVLAAAPLATSCAAGRSPQTALPTQLVEGVNASVHQIDIRDTFLLGADAGAKLQAGGSAPLYAWFVNDGSRAGPPPRRRGVGRGAGGRDHRPAASSLPVGSSSRR